MIIKVIPPRPRAPSSKKGGASKARKTARTELADDPIEDAGGHASLWQDDDDAPVPTPPVSQGAPGPSSRSVRAASARTRQAQAGSSAAAAEEATPSASQQLRDHAEELLDKLRQLRLQVRSACFRPDVVDRRTAQLAKDEVDEEDVMPDFCLQLLSVMPPSGMSSPPARDFFSDSTRDPDGTDLKRILVNELGDKQANHIYRQYGRQFLYVCTTFAMR